MVPTVRVTTAGFAFFLDVHHFPARGHLAVPADDAAACEGCEPEEPNETHHVYLPEITLSNIRTRLDAFFSRENLCDYRRRPV